MLEIKSKELETYKELNIELQNQVYSLNDKLNKSDSELVSNNLNKEKISMMEKEVNSLLDELTENKQENNKLIQEVHSLKRQLANYEEKYSGENSLESMNKKLEQIRNQNIELYSTLEEQKIVIREFNSKCKAQEYEVEEFTTRLNDQILNITKWFEIFFTSLDSESILNEFPKFKDELNKGITATPSLFPNCSSINFEYFKNSSFKMKVKYSNELKELEKRYNDEKNAANSLIQDKSRLQSEISRLKQYIMDIEQESYKQKEFLNKKLEEAENKLLFEAKLGENKHLTTKSLESEVLENKKLIEKTNKKLEEIFIALNLPRHNLIETNPTGRITEMLDILSQHVNNLSKINMQEKTTSEENLILKNELLKSRKENTNLRQMTSEEIQRINQNYEQLQKTTSKKLDSLESQVYTLKTILHEKEEEVTRLRNEMISMKSSSANDGSYLHLNYQENIYNQDKLQIDKLQRKISNLQREIELKSIQISSQEQMLIRRNNEIDELKKIVEDKYSGVQANSNVINNNNYNNEIKNKIDDLENDKSKLIKDNLNLIHSNQELKKAVNDLTSEVDRLNSKINEKDIILSKKNGYSK